MSQLTRTWLHADIASILPAVLSRPSHSCRSNGLFKLWNKYERKVRREVFSRNLLATGDALYRAEVRNSNTDCASFVYPAA